jgi:Fe2+ transport system protein FeoA
VKSPDPTAPSSLSLAGLRRGEAGVVSGLADGAGFEEAPERGAILLARLRDLGFVAGARCEVIARMWPAGDPLVVRIGGSTFALRRTEADAVRVTRVSTQSAARAQLAPKESSAALV